MQVGDNLTMLMYIHMYVLVSKMITYLLMQVGDTLWLATLMHMYNVRILHDQRVSLTCIK